MCASTPFVNQNNLRRNQSPMGFILELDSPCVPDAVFGGNTHICIPDYYILKKSSVLQIINHTPCSQIMIIIGHALLTNEGNPFYFPLVNSQTHGVCIYTCVKSCRWCKAVSIHSSLVVMKIPTPTPNPWR
jgi:hypothetical protein